MYLEMLYNRYSAELEKQAMEKQALSPIQLLRMGRRFAARGKLDRFGQLIAKRNNVIKNTDVFAKRQKLANDLWDIVQLEKKWLGRSGPASKQYAAAVSRTPTYAQQAGDLKYVVDRSFRDFFNRAELPHTMGQISHAELADVAAPLVKYGLL